MHHDNPETQDYPPNAISINVFTLLKKQKRKYNFLNMKMCQIKFNIH